MHDFYLWILIQLKKLHHFNYEKLKFQFRNSLFASFWQNWKRFYAFIHQITIVFNTKEHLFGRIDKGLFACVSHSSLNLIWHQQHQCLGYWVPHKSQGAMYNFDLIKKLFLFSLYILNFQIQSLFLKLLCKAMHT